MSSEYTFDNLVTDFLLNTCSRFTQPSIRAVQAALLSGMMISVIPKLPMEL